MIAEATTCRAPQQPQQRGRTAARQQTSAALRDTLAERVGLPAEGPALECAEPLHSAAEQQTLDAFWEHIRERQREALEAQSEVSCVPAAVPARAPPPTSETPQFVVPNVITGEAPVVRKPWSTFADVLRTYEREYRRIYGAELTVQQDKVLREMLASYTPLLGMHEWTCGDCGTVVELPNGCNNRHCCTCGYAKRTR